ncbi:hypothetical protein Syun_008972 [Stephania yunnanensis]|uniref:PEP-utilising enzyme C-terminal domain-containing protein n=1 Tax=Stephania yunnanensis TaxID=152371 RepID=A0AAP0KFB4_9MAGN
MNVPAMDGGLLKPDVVEGLQVSEVGLVGIVEAVSLVGVMEALGAVKRLLDKGQKELEHQVSLIRDVSKKVFSKMGTSIAYEIGTMIEIPRAALVADERLCSVSDTNQRRNFRKSETENSVSDLLFFCSEGLVVQTIKSSIPVSSSSFNLSSSNPFPLKIILILGKSHSSHNTTMFRTCKITVKGNVVFSLIGSDDLTLRSGDQKYRYLVWKPRFNVAIVQIEVYVRSNIMDSGSSEHEFRSMSA